MYFAYCKKTFQIKSNIISFDSFNSSLKYMKLWFGKVNGSATWGMKKAMSAPQNVNEGKLIFISIKSTSTNIAFFLTVV